MEAAKPRRRRTKVEQRADKMEQILDAAEYLFSIHGLYGVTLKDVAQRVGVLRIAGGRVVVENVDGDAQREHHHHHGQ